MPSLDDLIGFKDCKISINVEGKVKEYEIDYQKDSVLKEFGLSPCSEIGTKIDQKLTEWSSRYDEMN
jgi:hypothetical protein